MSEKIKNIALPLKSAKWLLRVGIPLCLLTPLIFTRSCEGPNFLATGQIGDTIGGITAPFINLLGAILVFLALKAQVEANLLIQEQIDEQAADKKIELESKQLHTFYENLKTSIDNYTYSTLDTSDFHRSEVLKGSEAIFELFQEFFCNSEHVDEEQLKGNPKLTELLSILEICDLLLEKIKNSNSPDKETLWILTKHQFEYRIFPRMKTEFPNNLERRDCSSCNQKHGLPENICKLLIGINKKLETPLN